jgi:hypothetical protein
MDEIALREAMVAGIRRSLFGPDSLESMIWPGSSKPATLIDSDFQPKESRPIGPWVHADGQEILDQLPHRIYGTGVLYSTKVVSAKDIPDAVMELDDEEDETSQPISVEEAQDEVDDEVNQLEQRNGSIPQSLAFSIRVPEDINFVDVSLEFGTYSEFSVDKQKNSWWKREPRKETLRLSTTTERSEKEVQFDTYLVKIGTYVR